MKPTVESLTAEIESAILKVAILTRELQLIRRNLLAVQIEPPQQRSEPSASPAERFLNTTEVLRATSIKSRVTLWTLEKQGAFPSRVKVSANRIAWRESDISAFMRSRSTSTGEKAG